MEVLNKEVKDGVLSFDINGHKFRIMPHPGSKALRARRLVRKVFAPQIAAQAKLMGAAERKMPAEQKELLNDLREKAAALEGSGGPELKAIEDQLQKLMQAHVDGQAQADAFTEMLQSIDLDDEAILDALLFMNAKVDGQPLSNPAVFDTTFTGKNAEMVEIIRSLIIEFNGFLDLTGS